MKLLLLIAIVTTVATLAVLIVVALYRHKKSSIGDFKLIGEIAHVDTELDPEGTVIVGGELWHARSKGGVFISPHARVRVVGLDGHLVLVEGCD